jgi:hypothetical protein
MREHDRTERASNTSSIPIMKLAAVTAHPQRVIGMQSGFASAEASTPRWWLGAHTRWVRSP